MFNFICNDRFFSTFTNLVIYLKIVPCRAVWNVEMSLMFSQRFSNFVKIDPCLSPCSAASRESARRETRTCVTSERRFSSERPNHADDILGSSSCL